MERYSAILIRGIFAAAPPLVARSLGIEIAKGAQVVELSSTDAAYALSDKKSRTTRNVIFYQHGEWTVFGDWNFEFVDDRYPIGASGVLDTEVISLQGVEDEGFGFTYANSGKLVRSVIAGMGRVQQVGSPLAGEPAGSPGTWDFEAPLVIADAFGAPNICEQITVPCYALELNLP